MAIRVTYPPVPASAALWTASVPTTAGQLAVGQVQQVSGDWRARPRGGNYDRTMAGFLSRAEAATWLLLSEDVARPAQQVAA